MKLTAIRRVVDSYAALDPAFTAPREELRLAENALTAAEEVVEHGRRGTEALKRGVVGSQEWVDRRVELDATLAAALRAFGEPAAGAPQQEETNE